MPATGNPGSELQRSLDCIVVQLQGELDELLREKARVKLRARTLRRRLGILQTGSGNERRPRRNVNTERRAQARKMGRVHEELWRACRIAFLDLRGTATTDELHAAILRRGSFSFTEMREKPANAIMRILSAMCESGEVTRHTDNSQSRWKHNTVSTPPPTQFQ